MTTLVIFAGQSELGLGMSTATLPTQLQGPIAGAYMFTGSSNFWGGLTPGAHTVFPNTPGTWGAADQFAYDFRQAHPDETLLIVEVGKGSTGVARDDGATDWSPDSRGELFDLTTATIAKARAAFEAATGETAPTASAVFFMGMETDATSATKAAAAYDNLTGLAAAIRDQWMGDAAGHVGITRISDTPALAHNEAVRVAQWRVDQDDAHLSSVKTVGLERQADDLHYAASAQVAIGHSFASIFDAWF